jgi:hypothetical protein
LIDEIINNKDDNFSKVTEAGKKTATALGQVASVLVDLKDHKATDVNFYKGAMNELVNYIIKELQDTNKILELE